MDLIAHRGYNGVYFENSINAVIYSLKQKYIKGIELDVRVTKDNEFVIVHDNFLNRVSKNKELVSLINLNQLKQVPIGNDNYTFIISTLEEILKIIKVSKKILIEIKFKFNKKTFDKLNEILNKYNHLNIYVFSLSKEGIDYFKKICKKIKTGLLIGPFMNIDENYDFLVLHHSHYQKKIKSELFFWTVNDEKVFLKIKNKNIKCSIITDKSYFFRIKYI